MNHVLHNKSESVLKLSECALFTYLRYIRNTLEINLDL